MPDEVAQGRLRPAAAGNVTSSAGECGVKDQVSRSRPATSPAGLALVGATATGKTSLAVALARRLGGLELVSVDAMAVYRGLDVGTAKPTAEERAGLRWHLLDLVEPSEQYSVFAFAEASGAALASIELRAARPILVGGTGLYHRAALGELELAGRFPELAERLEEEADLLGVEELHRRLASLDALGASRIAAANRRRVVRALEVTLGTGRPFSSFGAGLEQYRPSRYRIVGLRIGRAELDRRIGERLEAQLAAGFLDEVRRLAAAPGGLSRTARQALGYRELLEHLDGATSLDEAVATTLRRTRSFARRQEAWFGRDPRVEWLEADGDDLLEHLVAMLDIDRTDPGEV